MFICIDTLSPKYVVRVWMSMMLISVCVYGTKTDLAFAFLSILVIFWVYTKWEKGIEEHALGK